MKILIFICLLQLVYLALAKPKACNTYTVQKGDTCYSLGIDPNLNPSINCYPLVIGSQICVTYKTLTCDSTSYSYTIKSGDTCYSIGVSVSYASSQGLNCANLQIGAPICVPYYKPASSVTCSSGYQHTVVSGETCYALGISTASAQSQGINCANLQIGQVVCAQSGSSSSGSTCSNGYQYTIKNGDTCNALGITQTAAANQGINCNNLQVGQVVCVPNNVITTTQQSSTSCAQGTYAYTIKSGDTCNLLGISAASAQAQGLNCQNLQIGQVVCASYYIQSTTTASNGKSCGANSYLYTVRSGDTCYSLRITQAYASSNNINCSPLQPGQSICLPLTLFTSTVYYTTTTTMPYLSIYCGLNTYSYTIKNGDSCFSLGITQELAKAQNINCNLLQVGQTICAPYYTSPNTPSTTLVCSTNYYTVKPGDSCQSISASRNYLYTDLIALNGGTLNCNALSPNQVICV